MWKTMHYFNHNPDLIYKHVYNVYKWPQTIDFPCQADKFLKILAVDILLTNLYK